MRGPLTAGLDGDGRLTVGVSAAVHSAEGLRGALGVARHARRVAAARPARVCAAGHQGLASHVLLLPFVPDASGARGRRGCSARCARTSAGTAPR
ncbi:Regulatory protein OS=Streptomyces albaduncus OX=68172 GN=FHS32_001277 PE=3 SV=1 [Streptomyces griseoloalbus]